MIITVTVNPAIDRTITVDRLVFEDRAYITSSRETAGGRGINAACVIHSFGGEAVAIVPAGGKSGALFEEYLDRCGFELVVVPIRNEVRNNLIITDKQGLTVKLNERGATIKKPTGAPRKSDPGESASGKLADDLRQPAPGVPADLFMCN